jgi:hypothetical protein
MDCVEKVLVLLTGRSGCEESIHLLSVELDPVVH